MQKKNEKKKTTLLELKSTIVKKWTRWDAVVDSMFAFYCYNMMSVLWRMEMRIHSCCYCTAEVVEGIVVDDKMNCSILMV